MGMFHRKSKWEKLSNQVKKRSGQFLSDAASKPAVKTGAAAATGAVAITAASAVVSALRRRANS